MKKLFALVFALLMLCACGMQEKTIEEPQSEAEIVQKPAASDSETADEQKTSDAPEVTETVEPEITEQEKNPLENGAVFVGKLAGKDIYAIEVSKITKPHRLFDEDRKQYLADAERTLYKLFDSEGKEIVPHLTESYDLFVPGSMGNDGENHLYCLYEGNFYIYDAENNFELIRVNKSGPTGEFLNGFEVTLQYWEVFYPYETGRGLNRPDGSVFLEPIYQKIEAPFSDRFLAEYGVVSQAVECFATDIIDLNGNVLSDCFNTVEYYFLDDGSYIGIGRYYGTELICRDKNGNEYEKGNWFIDKDGNKISENFAELFVEYSGYMEDFKLGTNVNVTTAEGENKTLPIETYALKP